MNAERRSALLDHYAGPLTRLLDGGEVSEISVNPDGRVWIQKSGETQMRPVDISMTFSQVTALGRGVASHSNVTIGRDKPIVSANVPTANGTARVLVVIPPAATGVGAVSIRLLGVVHVGLGAFPLLGGATRLLDSYDTDALKAAADAFASGRSTIVELMAQAVEQKWNVVISGGTDSGKTTYLNGLLDLVSHSDRIITIEETAELIVTQPNVVRLLADRSRRDSGRGPIQLMEATLRLRPDRLIAGEIRGDDAAMFLELVNTGHEGSFCTLHANSPLDAIARLTKMVRRGSPTVTREEVEDDIRATIHVIVQLRKATDRRGVVGVNFPPLFDLSKAEY